MSHGERFARACEEAGVVVTAVLGFRGEGMTLGMSTAFRRWLRESPGRADRVAEVVAKMVRNGAAKPLDDLELVVSDEEGE